MVIAMHKKRIKMEIIGFVFVSILGTLCHFFYEWSGYSNVVGMFCPINESTWEHLKLLWFPFLIWTIAEYFILDKPSGYWAPKCTGILIGLTATTSFYYTYYGIGGKGIMFWDVFSFFLGVAAAFITGYLLNQCKIFQKPTAQAAALILFIGVSVIFVIFTFSPPLIPWFRDPMSLTYGI